MSDRVYLDYATSTPLDYRVKEAMEPFWDSVFANPGSSHQDGLQAKKAVQESREKIARVLGVKDSEITFTSGGTESNNLAILGFLNNLEEEGRLKDAHLITTEIEHPSVLEIFKKYQKKGIDVDFAPITNEGLVDLAKLEKLIKENTTLVSIALVNSEIGAVQPIRKISKLLRSDLNSLTRLNLVGFPVLHSDASQAPLWLSVKADSLGVDMMTLDGHKIYGPKGVGVLYKNSKVKISPIIFGGSQEKKLWPGTEATPLIVGMAEALKISQEERVKTSDKISSLGKYFIQSLFKINSKIALNGSLDQRVPGIINISVLGEDSEFLHAKLDRAGVSCSTKSACLEKNQESSYVLKALAKPNQMSGLRFSLGRQTTKPEINKVVEIFKKILT